MEIFGRDNFVAARPGSFASNNVQFGAGIQRGHVRVLSPDTPIDCVVPEDIGRVCGTILAKGPQDDQRVIYLYGPELRTQREAIMVIAKVLGKTVTVEPMSEEEVYKMYVEDHKLPEPYAKYLIRQATKTPSHGLHCYGYPLTQAQLSNVEKYSGKPATRFEQWVEQNKDKFGS